MSEVATNFKSVGPCEGDHATCMFKDRCPIEGTLYAKSKDKKLRVRNCKDAVSRGRSSRRGGLDKQRKVAKALNVPMTHSLRPGQEEHYGGTVRIEVKSGAQVGPLVTAFLKAEKQSEGQRPIGDSRPFIMASVPKAGTDVIYAFRASNDDQLRDVAYALAQQFGFVE